MHRFLGIASLVAGLIAPPAAGPVPFRPATELIVPAAWLSQHLQDRDLVVLQTGRKEDYDQEHIAGARYLENGLESETMEMTALPAPAAIQAKLEKLGVSDRSHVVVVYVGRGAPSATRVVYLMHHAGLDNVSLLDGGMAAWHSAGLPVTRDTAIAVRGRITVTGTYDAAADYAWVEGHLKSSHVRIVDARDANYFTGPALTGMGMAGGHIPGARSLPYTSLFSATGLLLPRPELEAKFRAAGVQPGDTVVAYCHVGIQATTVVLAARVIGQPVRMYVGSFHDWSARKLPTEGGTP